MGLGAILLAWCARPPRPPALASPPSAAAAQPQSTPPPPPSAEPAVVEGRAEDVERLRRRGLAIPVAGVGASGLRDTFADARDGHRRHEAIDLLAPRGTKVVAVDDGTVVKLVTSSRGGRSIYQFDAGSSYCYYYAHLDRYALRLREGQSVRKGQTIGYVGASGNASWRTPHLHFAIFKLGPEKAWSQGTPLNPHLIWRR